MFYSHGFGGLPSAVPKVPLSSCTAAGLTLLSFVQEETNPVIKTANAMMINFFMVGYSL